MSKLTTNTTSRSGVLVGGKVEIMSSSRKRGGNTKASGMRELSISRKFSLADLVGHINKYISLVPVNSVDDINTYISNILYKMYIHSVVVGDPKSGKIRILLTSRPSMTDAGYQLVRECNGAILEISLTSCAIAARPMPNFVDKIDRSRNIDEMLSGDYQVVEMEDGTTMNMYYFDGQWRFSTKHMPDAKDIVWRGHTYEEVLRETLMQYAEFGFDKLNPEMTYTFGFKHPHFHPFNQHVSPKMGAWFIRATYNKTGEISYVNTMGIPDQTVIRDPIWRDLLKRSRDALGQYISGGAIFMGFIIRPVAAQTSENLVMIQSSLMHEIKYMIYQAPRQHDAVKQETFNNHFRNFDFVILAAYMDYGMNASFKALFPQYVDEFAKYDKLFDSIIEDIITPAPEFEYSKISRFFAGIVDKKTRRPDYAGAHSHHAPTQITLGHFIKTTPVQYSQIARDLIVNKGNTVRVYEMLKC